MKLLIIGSRSIDSFDISSLVPKETNLIISGGAKGIDKIAEKYADDNNISKLIMRPEYKLYGKAAPLKRNEAMINIADKIIIIWDGKSKGTEYSIRYAKNKNKSAEIILFDNDKINKKTN